MTEMLLDGLRHLLTLLFGIGVSAAFLDIAPTRKNIVILSVFSALDLSCCASCFYCKATPSHMPFIHC